MATFYEVPAGTRAAQCRGQSCKATVYWIVAPSGKRMPVDCDVDGGWEPTEREAGNGVSHFTTCPDVRQFSAKNR